MSLDASRTRRIRGFLLLLVLLNLPLLIVGIFDFHASPWTLVLVLASYAYYLLYYFLLRKGYGVQATYGCMLLLVILITLGIHNGAGALSITGALYFLLLVGVALVLDSVLAVDATMVCCLLAYIGLVLFEAYVEPPGADAFLDLFTNGTALGIGSALAGMFIALIGCWLIMRVTLVGLAHSTTALNQARAEAERRAGENATLAAQVQAGNESLLGVQALLRDTIDVLTLPLIPLQNGVALLPLIGYLDDARAEQLLTNMLQGIYAQRAQTIILDMTGLREVDTHAVSTLLQATQAAQLLGTKVILSGISAQAAKVLVNLDANLQGLRTAASLGDALEMIAAQP